MKDNLKKMSRRDFLKMAGLGSMGAVLAACGGDTTPWAGSTPDQKTAVPGDPTRVVQPTEVVAEPTAVMVPTETVVPVRPELNGAGGPLFRPETMDWIMAHGREQEEILEKWVKDYWGHAANPPFNKDSLGGPSLQFDYLDNPSDPTDDPVVVLRPGGEYGGQVYVMPIRQLKDFSGPPQIPGEGFDLAAQGEMAPALLTPGEKGNKLGAYKGRPARFTAAGQLAEVINFETLQWEKIAPRQMAEDVLMYGQVDYNAENGRGYAEYKEGSWENRGTQYPVLLGVKPNGKEEIVGINYGEEWKQARSYSEPNWGFSGVVMLSREVGERVNKAVGLDEDAGQVVGEYVISHSRVRGKVNGQTARMDMPKARPAYSTPDWEEKEVNVGLMELRIETSPGMSDWLLRDGNGESLSGMAFGTREVTGVRGWKWADPNDSHYVVGAWLRMTQEELEYNLPKEIAYDPKKYERAWHFGYMSLFLVADVKDGESAGYWNDRLVWDWKEYNVFAERAFVVDVENAVKK